MKVIVRLGGRRPGTKLQSPTADASSPRADQQDLYTGTFTVRSAAGGRLCFFARVDTAAGFLRAAQLRMGGCLPQAQLRVGFDPSDPVVLALVSEPLADMLSLAAEAPTSALAEQLEIMIDLRFAR